jgi:hypothetical protein
MPSNGSDLSILSQAASSASSRRFWGAVLTSSAFFSQNACASSSLSNPWNSIRLTCLQTGRIQSHTWRTSGSFSFHCRSSGTLKCSGLRTWSRVGLRGRECECRLRIVAETHSTQGCRCEPLMFSSLHLRIAPTSRTRRQVSANLKIHLPFSTAGVPRGVNSRSSSRQASLKSRKGSSAPLSTIARSSGTVLFGKP